MKKCSLFVAIATLMFFLCGNTTNTYGYSTSTTNVIYEITPSDNMTPNFEQSTCASTCNAVSHSDCGNAIYEIDEFPGSAAHSTSSGDGSGLGCEYYGFSSPLVLGSSSGSSFTRCTEYTASSDEASYITYLNAGNSNCISRSMNLYKANSCSNATGLVITQPTNTLPGTARGLVVGESYVVCNTYTENGCSDDFASSVFEVCMVISEASYCSSSFSTNSVTACSGEDIQINLNNCTVDSDLGVAGGTPGYAAFYYSTDGGSTYTNFPANSIAEDIGTSANFKFYDESNASNGGGCSPVTISSIINTSCQSLVIPVGIVSIDVASIGAAFLSVLPNCPIIETNVTIHPQLTSQVSGNNIQLISAGGTICQTIPVGSGTGGGYTSGSSSSGLNDDTNNTNTNQGTINFPNNTTVGNVNINGNNPRPGLSQQTIPGIGVQGTNITPPPPSGSSSSSTTTEINVPCVTPSGNRVSTTGETLVGHTVEISDGGELVIVLDEPIPSQIKVYPNPASNQLFFNTSQADNYVVRIYDTFGKQVFYTETNDDAPLDISHLPSGLYTYALENEAQTLRNHGKWVKQ